MTEDKKPLSIAEQFVRDTEFVSTEDAIGTLDVDAYDAMMKDFIVGQLVNRIELAVPTHYAKLAAEDIYEAIKGAGVKGVTLDTEKLGEQNEQLDQR